MASLTLQQGHALRSMDLIEECVDLFFHPEVFYQHADLLPSGLAMRETLLIVQVLALPEAEPAPPVPPGEFARAMIAVDRNLSLKQRKIIDANGDLWDATRAERCNAGISYYTRILDLPTRPRRVVLRGILGG